DDGAVTQQTVEAGIQLFGNRHALRWRNCSRIGDRDEWQRRIWPAYSIIPDICDVLLQGDAARLLWAHLPVSHDEFAVDVQRGQVDSHYPARPAVVAQEVHRQLQHAGGAALAQLDVGQALGLVHV